MTGSDLVLWRATMKLSKLSAAKALGCSRVTLDKYESGASAIPLYVALACAAISYGLPPWR